MSSTTQITLYPRWAIIIFSLFLTGIGATAMFTYNLRQAEKKVNVALAIIGTLAAHFILINIVKLFTDDPLILVLFPNITIGILIAYPVWNYTMLQLPYTPKKIWIPLLCTALLWGSIAAIDLLYIH
jgi:lipopolysaccharide export LptBFGC system permease protein LptF